MFQNTLNFLPQTGYTIKAVEISTSFNLFCEDKDFKNDPDIKQFMKEINSDFKVDTRTKSEFTTNYNEDEPSNDIKKEAISQKNISQLLSEIYGDTTSDREDTSTSIGGYKKYVDSDSEIIYDIDEERELLRQAYLKGEITKENIKQKPSRSQIYQHMSRTRGEKGVFEISEIVDVLTNEKISDIAVIRIPPQKQYADFMVIGTGRNTRHLRSVAALINSLFKEKRYSSDPIPRREGENDANTGWTAMDMGNIVLHLLTQENREYYDLETLWTVGPEFDDKTKNIVDNDSDVIETLESLMATDMN